MESTPSRRADPGSGDPRPEALPVDPDLTPAERLPAAPRPVRPGPGSRRRAEPRLLSARFARALIRRRDVVAVIAVGGALGSLGRWALGEVLPHRPGTFAWSTFLVNVSGCLLIGLLMVFAIEVWPPSRYLRPFLGVGVLGGYTTFSTAMLDARTMLLAGNTATAGAYLFGSIAAGFAGVWVAILTARGMVKISRRRRNRRWDREGAESAGPFGPHRAGRADRADRADRSDRASWRIR